MYSMYICIIVRCVYNLQKHTRSWNSWKHQTITQATAKPSLKLPLQPFPPPEHRTFWRIDNYWWTKTWSKYGYIYVYMYVYMIVCIYICICACVCKCIYGGFNSAYGLDPSIWILVGYHGFPPWIHSLDWFVGENLQETRVFTKDRA